MSTVCNYLVAINKRAAFFAPPCRNCAPVRVAFVRVGLLVLICAMTRKATHNKFGFEVRVERRFVLLYRDCFCGAFCDRASLRVAVQVISHAVANFDFVAFRNLVLLF